MKEGYGPNIERSNVEFAREVQVRTPSAVPRCCGLTTIILVTCAITAFVVQNMDQRVIEWMASESGPAEVFGVSMFVLAALLAAWNFARERSLLRFAGTVMLVWAILRELDFQKRFTYRSVESLGYYTRPYAPLGEKFLVLLILAPFVVAGLYLLVNFARRLRPALALREAWAGQGLAALAIGVAAMFLEKILKMDAAEEVCEAGLAAIILTLVWSTRLRAGNSKLETEKS